MSMLHIEEVIARGIVCDRRHNIKIETRGARDTTYDSTVGDIFNHDGEKIDEEYYTLKPRGLAWVVSNEVFRMPKDVTGITTLKTGWTKKGILTLTVGIVDPGYEGHLSTAVINFGKDDFYIEKSKPFFRTAFFGHKESSFFQPTKVKSSDYMSQVREQTSRFSDTFLTIDTLAEELSNKLFSLPRWAMRLSMIGLAATLLLFALTYLYSIVGGFHQMQQDIEILKLKLEELG